MEWSGNDQGRENILNEIANKTVAQIIKKIWDSQRIKCIAQIIKRVQKCRGRGREE